MRAISAVLIASALYGCTVYYNPGTVHNATQSSICVVGMCESADEIDRIGDPSAGGNVQEQVDEANQIGQGQEGSLEVTP